MNPVAKTVWLYALDPVHVGTGASHLSHVDLQIVRDPGDRLPKIPATTLNGNSRTGAARYWENNGVGHRFCAGVGTKDLPHCGACPVCFTFGTSLEKSERMGALAFRDGLLALFPLYSYSHGPLWVTSHSRCRQLLAKVVNLPVDADPARIYTNFEANLVALGRRLVTVQAIDRCPVTKAGTTFDSLKNLLDQKIVVVPDALFSRLVNENLEVRTSVSIDPFTGAAESGALFTYESLPRTSLLAAEIIFDQSRWRLPDEENVPADWPGAIELAGKGLDGLRLVGLGGMGSRGFGRVVSHMEEVTP